jgi:hypothetical protein
MSVLRRLSGAPRAITARPVTLILARNLEQGISVPVLTEDKGQLRLGAVAGMSCLEANYHPALLDAHQDTRPDRD